MERRIAGIVRWLDRCLKACKAGALESALMDAECARADIERLRDEVWKKLERRYWADSMKIKIRERSRFFWIPVKVVLGAFLVVALTGAAPLSHEHEIRESLTPSRQEPVSLEWVTPDEKVLLGHLRKHLSDNNPFALIQDPAQAAGREPVRAPRPQSAAHDNGNKKGNGSGNGNGNDVMNIPYDRIISLVQAGAKAMQKEAPAIKIEK